MRRKQFKLLEQVKVNGRIELKKHLVDESFLERYLADYQCGLLAPGDLHKHYEFLVACTLAAAGWEDVTLTPVQDEGRDTFAYKGDKLLYVQAKSGKCTPARAHEEPLKYLRAHKKEWRNKNVTVCLATPHGMSAAKEERMKREIKEKSRGRFSFWHKIIPVEETISMLLNYLREV